MTTAARASLLQVIGRPKFQCSSIVNHRAGFAIISAMSYRTPDPRWTEVDRYALNYLHPDTKTNPSNAVLQHAKENSARNGLPPISVSTTQGKFLMLQAKLLRAKNVLEIGTLGGCSAIWLASASPEIKILSLEVDETHAKVARENLAYAGVGARVEVRIGPALESLPGIAEEIQEGRREKFEMAFIDADKVNNWAYVDKVASMCQKGALLVVDNVVRRGTLADPKVNEPSTLGARQVVKNVGKDERFEGVVLQLVNDKSYDGFLLAVVN